MAVTYESRGVGADMPNEYATEAGREAFRKEFPLTSGIIPVDLLTRAHVMLAALDGKDMRIEGFDSELAAMLTQAIDHPELFATTNDGLHTLVWTNLHMRGMLHGDSSLWRTAVRAVDANDLPRARQTASMADYAKLLVPWIEAFENLLRAKGDSTNTSRG